MISLLDRQSLDDLRVEYKIVLRTRDKVVAQFGGAIDLPFALHPEFLVSTMSAFDALFEHVLETPAKISLNRFLADISGSQSRAKAAGRSSPSTEGTDNQTIPPVNLSSPAPSHSTDPRPFKDKPIDRNVAA